jgi:hypothetical protein
MTRVSASLAQALGAKLPTPAKGSKYGNRKTIVGSLTFDSAKEARRYGELSLLQRAGEISDLALHRHRPLRPRLPLPQGRQAGVRGREVRSHHYPDVSLEGQALPPGARYQGRGGAVRVVPAALFARVIEETATDHGLSPLDLLRKGRSHKIAHARQHAMWRLRSMTDAAGEPLYGFLTLGRAFGLDHTTILHGIRQHRKRTACPE